MTSEEFTITLQNFRDALPIVRDRVIVDAIYSATALAKQRVIRGRENAEGIPFGIYSPNYLKKRIRDGKGTDPRINFSYTGRMWQSTTPVITATNDEEVRIRVAPLDPQRNQVMGYHDDKYNEIMRLSDDETQLIIDLFLEEIQKFIDSTIHDN